MKNKRRIWTTSNILQMTGTMDDVKKGDVMHFNIISDPWLDVLYLDFRRKKIGLRDAIRDAHLIKCIKTETNLYVTEAAIRIFLVAFVADMLNSTSEKRLEPDGELLHFYMRGSFDMDIFDRYVEMCEKEGTSFDVFDDKKPLLQTDLETAKKVFSPKTLKAVTALDPTIPSGTNSVFFMEKCESEVPENDFSMTPDEYWVKLLTYQTTLSPASGRGYNPGRFVTFSPLYLFPEGENLFETLLRAFPVFNRETKEQLPIWRRKYAYDGDLHEVGYMSDAIAPTQNIRYAECNSEGNVTKIHKSRMDINNGGTIDHGRESLRSYPYFLTREVEKKGEMVPECFAVYSEMTTAFEVIASLLSEIKKSENAVELSTYRYNLTSKDSFLNHIPSLSEEKTRQKYTGYGIQMNRAKPVSQVKITFTLPGNLDNMERANVFKEYFREIEKVKIKAFYASLSYHGTTKEEYDRLKKEKGEKAKKTVKDVDDFQKQLVFRLYDILWDRYTEDVEAFNALKKEEDYALWLKTARGQIFRACQEAYVDIARKHKNKMVRWTGGYLIMGTGSMDYRKKNNNYYEQVKVIRNNMISSLAKGDLYKLRDNLGKRYDADPYMALLVNIMKATTDDEVGKPFQDDHTYLYACLMAKDVIDIKSNSTSGNTGEQTGFADYLCSMYEENGTSRRNVEILLATDDIFSNINQSKLLTILRRAQRKNNVNVMGLCADLEDWKNTRRRWAEKIGKHIAG